MDKKKINEYLAINLFNLKYDNHIKQWTQEMPAYFRKGIANVPIELPDFIENYQKVLEKICDEVTIQFYRFNENEVHCEINDYDNCADYKAIGITYGEAICRCAVEYLEWKNGIKS